MKHKLIVFLILMSLFIVSSGRAFAQGPNPPSASNDPRMLIDDLSTFMDPPLGIPRRDKAGFVSERPGVKDPTDLTDDSILTQRAYALHHLVFRAVQHGGKPCIGSFDQREVGLNVIEDLSVRIVHQLLRVLLMPLLRVYEKGPRG